MITMITMITMIKILRMIWMIKNRVLEGVAPCFPWSPWLWQQTSQNILEYWAFQNINIDTWQLIALRNALDDGDHPPESERSWQGGQILHWEALCLFFFFLWEPEYWCSDAQLMVLICQMWKTFWNEVFTSASTSGNAYTQPNVTSSDKLTQENKWLWPNQN